MSGSPSSWFVVLSAIQSSRRLDKPTLRIVTSGNLCSSEVCTWPCTACEMRRYTALSVCECAKVRQ